MTPAPDRTRNGTAGAVLRDVALRAEPRALLRPGAPRREAVVAPAGPHDRDGAASGAEHAREAAAAVETALEEARAAGFARGLEEGRRAGLAEGRDAARQQNERDQRAAHDAIKARLSQLDALVQAFHGELSKRLAAAEGDMVALSHGAICRLLGEQLITAEGVAQWVRQALRESTGTATLDGAGQRELTVHLHPRDLERMEADAQVSAWMRQQHPGAAAATWVADERVGLGGCVVRSADGSLDARLETQMAALRHLLARGEQGDEAGAATSAAAVQSPAEGSSEP